MSGIASGKGQCITRSGTKLGINALFTKNSAKRLKIRNAQVLVDSAADQDLYSAKVTLEA